MITMKMCIYYIVCQMFPHYSGSNDIGCIDLSSISGMRAVGFYFSLRLPEAICSLYEYLLFHGRLYRRQHKGVSLWNRRCIPPSGENLIIENTFWCVHPLKGIATYNKAAFVQNKSLISGSGNSLKEAVYCFYSFLFSILLEGFCMKWFWYRGWF